jgi:two-component system nitrogen regulation sensor histidine kinase NtrY
MFRSNAPDTQAARESRPRLLDNPRVLTVAAFLLLALLAGLFWLSERTSQIAPGILADVLLYPLLAVDLTLLAALFFVLARNLIKLWVEHRQSAPFARFRAKLVAALLAMTIIPSVLVLISGSQIVINTAQQWFSEPVGGVLDSAQQIARRYYQDRQETTAQLSRRLARSLPAEAVLAGDVGAIDLIVRPIVRGDQPFKFDGLIEVYRASASASGPATVEFLVSETLIPVTETVRASADRLAARAVAMAREESTQDDLDSGGVLVRTAQPIRDGTGATIGAVVISQHLDAGIMDPLRRATGAYDRYRTLVVLRGPIQGFYLAIFLAVTLLILVSATWLGLYLAKRITRPVQMLAEGARAIGAGRLDVRLEPETSDELGSLVESFNMMAAELRTSQEKLELSRSALEHKNIEVDARRRYIETILERVATGVISLDAEGRISTVNGAAERLLGLDARVIGRAAAEVLDREDLRPLLPLVEATRRSEPRGVVQEVTLAREEREIHLATAATVLTGEGGHAEGAVLVLDDVTPLIRAQRVAAWRDVARRLAHEIKNPLTPIQLSAERLRRHFTTATPEVQGLVAECTEAIIAEVESLKGLVDEFAQFARLRGPRTLPSDLNRLVEDTLRLYAGVLPQGHLRIERALATDLPAVRLDGEQMRQVIINLVDNAMEALGGPSAPMRPGGQAPTILVATTHDRRDGVVRLLVSDNGPGVPAGDRDRLFMPYYSTKGRGSGLGLAIVRRIIVEHGGAIAVGDAAPSGTTFTVELPAA